MQTHLVSKIMHQKLAVILLQINYGKNSLIVLVKVDTLIPSTVCHLLASEWYALCCP